MVGGGGGRVATPFIWNNESNWPRWSENADFQAIFAHSASAVTPSETFQFFMSVVVAASWWHHSGWAGITLQRDAVIGCNIFCSCMISSSACWCCKSPTRLVQLFYFSFIVDVGAALRHSGWRETYLVCKVSQSQSSTFCQN